MVKKGRAMQTFTNAKIGTFWWDTIGNLIKIIPSKEPENRYVAFSGKILWLSPKAIDKKYAPEYVNYSINGICSFAAFDLVKQEKDSRVILKYIFEGSTQQ
jgi:hypothetical protein